MNYELLSKIYYKDNENYEDIYKKRYNSYSTCHYNFKIGNYNAFIVINSEILSLITEILKQDKRLLYLSKTIPPIALSQFTKMSLIDEIKLTNELEGVNSTRREINQIINDIGSQKVNVKKNQRLHGLVQKYSMLISNQELSLSNSQDIRNIYDDLVLSEVAQDNTENIPDGNIFRKNGVDVLSVTGKVIHKGILSETKIIEYTDIALDILNNGENKLINIAVFHYMFGYIHPFYDGNGRTSRFISSYMLSKQLEPIVAFGLSYTIKQNLRKYYHIFEYTNDIKNHGELTGFVIEFLEIVKQSIFNICEALEIKGSKFEFYVKEILRLENTGKNAKELLNILLQNSLFAENGLSIEELSGICELSTSTIRNTIKILPENMLRVEYIGNKKLYDVDLDVLGKVK